MADEKKPELESKTDSHANGADAGQQSEIDQIMNEIEELQEEMNSAVASQSSSDAPPSSTDISQGEDLVQEAITASTAPEPAPAESSKLPEVDAEKELEELIQKEIREEAALKEKEMEAQTHSPLADIADYQEGLEDFAPHETSTMTQKAIKRSIMNLAKDDQDMESQSIGSDDSGSISMTVKGKISIQLDHQEGGQSVLVAFSSNGIHILLDDGTEFKIPHRTRTLKKVA